ncbi:unnamed protein product [Effrenium voratum]|nr:unnamed protein product [Effrenium voratum]
MSIPAPELSQAAILRHLATAAQEARRQHACANALALWRARARWWRLQAWLRRCLQRRRAALALGRWLAAARAEKPYKALVRSRLRAPRLRGALGRWAASAAARALRRTLPLRSACFARDRLGRRAWEAWRLWLSQRRQRQRELRTLRRRLLARRRPDALCTWRRRIADVVQQRAANDAAMKWRARRQLGANWSAWRGAVARQLRARRRQAEALELFHGATRREALRQLSARQLCRARRRQEAAVAAWAELRARGAPVLRAWRALCSGPDHVPFARARPSSSLELFLRGLREERSLSMSLTETWAE